MGGGRAACHYTCIMTSGSSEHIYSHDGSSLGLRSGTWLGAVEGAGFKSGHLTLHTVAEGTAKAPME